MQNFEESVRTAARFFRREGFRVRTLDLSTPVSKEEIESILEMAAQYVADQYLSEEFVNKGEDEDMKVYTVGQYVKTREDTLALELYGIFTTEESAEKFAVTKRSELDGDDNLDASDIIVEEVEVR